MSHVVFVDSNYPGIEAMRRAKVLGHEVTAILSEQMQLYSINAENRATLASLDRVIWIPSSTDAARVQDVLERLRADRGIDAVLTTLDTTVETLSIVCRRLGLRYTSADGARLARNKAAARQRLAECGVPSARFAFASDVDAAVAGFRRVGAPAVVKPASGVDSRLVSVVHDEHGARKAAHLALTGGATYPLPIREQFSRGVLVEEKLVGELLSVEIGMFGGAPIHYMVSHRRRACEDEVIELGTWMPANITTERWRECEAYAVRVCHALGLDLGIFHLEMIYTAEGPRLVEANPRLMGGGLPFLYARVVGTSIHDHLIAIHLGTPLAPPRLPEGRVGGNYAIAARDDGVLPVRVELEWLREFEPHLVFLDVDKLKPKAAVSAGEKLARFQLVQPSHRAIDLTSREIRARFEDALGLRLLTWP